jgi:exonuclease SbcD
MPPGIYRFGKNLEYFTYHRDGIAIADIYGMSFAKKEVKENLASRYKLRDNPSPFSIAVLHGTIGSAGAHHNYAPFELSDIRNESFDYWALGHIHSKAVVYDAHPMVVYPGNPQGRDFGECGAKGCFLVDIEQGQKPQIEFVPVQTIRFEKTDIDISGIDDITIISQKIAEAVATIEDHDSSVSKILRIKFTGRTVLHGQLNEPGASEDLRNSLNEDQLTEDPFLWVAQINIHTRPDINLDEISRGNDFPAEALQVFDQYSKDGDRRKELLKKIEAEMLSGQIKKELAALGIEDEKDLIEKAKWLILDQILTQ